MENLLSTWGNKQGNPGEVSDVLTLIDRSCGGCFIKPIKTMR
jgi:hypothetical protein